MQHFKQERHTNKFNNNDSRQAFRSIGLPAFFCLAILVSACNSGQSQASGKDSAAAAAKTQAQPPKDSVTPAEAPVAGPLDTALYNQKILQLANGDSSGRWPVKGAYPKPGALLPFKRIVAYYGNLYSKKMGALGEY